MMHTLLEFVGETAFVAWCVFLAVLLLFSLALYGNKAEANGAGAFGKIGLWAFGVLAGLTALLRWLL